MCNCTEGYESSDCNSCSSGFYVSSTQNGENTCSGKNIYVYIFLNFSIYLLHYLEFKCTSGTYFSVTMYGQPTCKGMIP